ncbi:MAG: heme ABC transporter ATP-binding protein [Nitrincola lacisaponensis]|uniref:heme ABC transporter ATP-binding protein n=1 Tax=Nitrincola lacisaponensis TaxID=267850 RepID=UPI0039198239
MLSAHDITLKLSGRDVLSQVSIAAPPGQMLAIMGPNGAGKSTLLKVLSGDFASVNDQVALNGQRLSHWRDGALAQFRAVMPQSVQLNFAFTVEEVIEAGIRHPMSLQARGVHIGRMLEMFDVGHLRQRNYLTLSGGEQQRVQLARVLAQLEAMPASAPRYLLLDECTSSLDLSHQHQVFSVLKAWVSTDQSGVIVVLHDLNLAAQYADSLLLMDQGQVVKQGSVHDVLQAQVLSDVYRYPVQVIEHPAGWPLVIAGVPAASACP